MHNSETVESRHVGHAYQLFMLFLCVYAILALLLSVVLPLTTQAVRILQLADFAVCALFFVDFLVNLWRAPKRLNYFLTWGWIDLLSSIPMVDAFRLGRVARILRILRVLRALKATKTLVSYLLTRRANSAFYSVLAISFSLIVISSIAMLYFEAGADGNIKTAEDALWWAMTTITTVGYGDKYPVTSEGRAVAAMLMTAGVGLFGTLSGVIASWFLTPANVKADEDITELRKTVVELRDLIERLQSGIRR